MGAAPRSASWSWLVALALLGAISSARAQELTCSGSLQPHALALAREKLGNLDQLPRYDLELELAADLQSFELRQRATFTNTSRTPLREVVFVVHANVANGAPPGAAPPVRLVQGGCLGRACQLEDIGGGYLRAQLVDSLGHGESVQVELVLTGRLARIESARTTFDGQLLESLQSLSQGSKSHDFGLLAWSDGIASLGGFYAVLAPRRNGVWDTSVQEPLGDLTSDELASFRVSARVPRQVRLAASGVRVEETNLTGERREAVFCAELVRDFAILASEAFSTVETTANDVRVRVHVTPAARGAAPQLLATAAQAISLFSDAFQPYPYREFDVVEAPLVGGVGGVEFSGLVTVARMMLGGQQTSSALGALLSSQPGLFPTPEEMLDMVVAHEVAHQWWHVLVGSDSRRAPFVDEGLAQWSALFFLERQRGSSVARRAEQQLTMSYQMMRMAGQRDRPASQPVNAFQGTLDYGGVVYGKGPLVYRELRQHVGERAFFAALAAYSRRYAFAEAPPGAFVDLLAQQGDAATVRNIARRWIDEAHGDADLGTRPSLGPLGKPILGGADLGGLLRALRSVTSKRR